MIYSFKVFLVVIHFLIGSTICLILSLLRPFHPYSTYIAGRLLGKGALFILGVDLEVRNRENLTKEHPVVFISNHQHNIDLFTIGQICPYRTVSLGKKSIKWIPLFGQFYWLSGHILIDRKNRSKALNAMAEVGKKMIEKNVSVWVFPEGTRSKGRGILPFKKGAFYAAIQAQRPVVPVAVAQYHRVVDFNKLKAGKIVMEVLPPIETNGMSLDQVNELKDKCHKLIVDKVNELDRELLNT